MVERGTGIRLAEGISETIDSSEPLAGMVEGAEDESEEKD